MEKKKCILKKWEAALLIGLCVCIIASLCSFTAECEDISTRVLRLHILANSDSPADQALKLKVRNRLLEVGSGLFDQVNTESEAEQVAAQRLDELKLAAEQVVRSEGYDYVVTVQLCRAWFDSREYSDVTLPAGEYNALRVLIGEGYAPPSPRSLFPRRKSDQKGAKTHGFGILCLIGFYQGLIVRCH